MTNDIVEVDGIRYRRSGSWWEVQHGGKDNWFPVLGTGGVLLDEIERLRSSMLGVVDEDNRLLDTAEATNDRLTAENQELVAKLAKRDRDIDRLRELVSDHALEALPFDLGGGRRIAIIEEAGSRPTEHVVNLYQDSWFIEHPIGCIAQPCPYTEAAMRWDEPPLPLGRYEMEMNGDLTNVMSENEDLFRIATTNAEEA